MSKRTSEWLQTKGSETMLSDMWTEALAQFFDSFPQNAQLPPSNKIAAGVLKYASEIAMLHNAACGKEERQVYRGITRKI